VNKYTKSQTLAQGEDTYKLSPKLTSSYMDDLSQKVSVPSITLRMSQEMLVSTVVTSAEVPSGH